MTRECSTELEVNGVTVILRMKKLRVHVVCLQLGFLSREKLFFPIKWAASNMKGSFVSKHETKVKELACLKLSIFLHLSLSIHILILLLFLNHVK